MKLKDYMVDNLSVRVFETRQEMGKCAGDEAAQAIRKAIDEKGYANVMFAAAPSQNETLESLCGHSEIDWFKVNAFHMDEYVGLDPTHPAGFRVFLKRAIFDRFPFRSVNLINGNAQNVDEVIEGYTRLLEENPLDVCLCGIGENGHIAFNDPSVADFNDKAYIKVVELDQKCRMQQIHDGCFDAMDKVPTHAFSVTIPGMCSASTMICSVPAKTKAEAVRAMTTGKISTACPATILRRHKDARLYCDKDSASLLV